MKGENVRKIRAGDLQTLYEISEGSGGFQPVGCATITPTLTLETDKLIYNLDLGRMELGYTSILISSIFMTSRNLMRSILSWRN